MVAYTNPQQRKKEESEKLRGERDQIKFIDIGLERWQVVRFRKARRRQEESKRKARGKQEESKRKARGKQEEGKTFHKLLQRIGYQKILRSPAELPVSDWAKLIAGKYH